jgi:hypothetical protein
MQRLLRILLVGVTISLLTTPLAWAQATAELNGRVTDESGAVLPGVTVTAVQTDTGFTRSVVTDGTGAYSMPNLPTGPYRLEVALQGFRTYIQTGIVLQVGGTPTINAVLAVGNLEETVSVEAAAPIVDVRSAGISEVVEQERILELPLQGRQVTDLIVLAGAAVAQGGSSSRSMNGGVNISVAGGVSFGVAYSLDGAMHNNPQDNTNLPMPFPDALQEFSVATSGLSAQYGMHSGASVNAVTKSGTNRFAGSAFDFVRDWHFNARNRFAALGPDGERLNDGLKRHQFGGTLGGPIARDRLFFFGGYQGTAIRQTPASLSANVPTAAMLAGDFTAFTSPGCNGGRQIVLRAPYVNNRVNPALFSPAALNLAGRLPKTDDPCGEVRYSRAEDQNQGQAVGRIDFQQSSNHTLFGRYMAMFVIQPPAYSKSDNVLTVNGGTGADNLAQSAAFGSTMVFGANAVNAFRAAFNRTSVHRTQQSFFEPHDLGSKVYNYSPVKEIGLSVTGGFSLSGGTSSSGDFVTNAYQLGDDLTLVRGRHQMALGATVAFWQMDFLTHARSGGAWSFNGSLTGLGLSDFLLGRVARLEHGGPGYLPMNQWHAGLYAQDAWRVSDRVTLNGGLRWEPYFGQNILNGAISNFSMENFRNNVKTSVYKNAPAGLIYPGDPGFVGRKGINTQWWNLSPRIGFAWDVSGDSRTAVRSSYGIAYDFQTAEYHNINAQAPPFGNRSLVEDPPGRMDDPYGHIGGDPHPFITNADTPYIAYGAFGAIDPAINSPRVQSWNVTLERQIGTAWGMTISYLGSHTDHLWNQIALNPGVFLGLGPCTLNGVSYTVCTTNANLNERRVFTLSRENPAAAALIGNLDLHTDIGVQNYRGLKLALRRRAAAGVSISGNYTWSRCYGDSTTGGFPQLASGYTDPSNPALDRGHCSQDRTHIGNVSAGVRTPEFANPVLRAVVSNWRVSGILSASAGSWLTVTAGGDRAFTGLQGQRAQQVSGDVYGDISFDDQGRILNYLNAAAFAQPAVGTLGNHESNSIRGPGEWEIDLALSRLLSLTGSQTLEFRAEAFNLLNHFNWGNPTTNITSGTFGRIGSQGSPRIMQFAVKYEF